MKHITSALLCAAVFAGAIASAQVASVNVVGYTTFDVTATTDWRQVPVQFKDATDGTAAKLSGISAANGLVVNDMIMVPVSNGGNPVYAQYKWNGTAWAKNDTYAVDGNGTATTTTTPEVTDVTFGVGTVIWFKRGDSEGTRSLSLQGEVATAATTVTLATGYNLISNPNPTDALTLSSWTGAMKLKDQILVQAAANTPTSFNLYTRRASGWQQSGSSTVTETITVPAGCVMWYVKATGSTIASITLPATISAE